MDAKATVDRVVRKLKREAGKLTHNKRAIFPSGRRVVSFTFDDFPLSASRAGATIIEERGIAGTYYAALGLFGTSSYPEEDELRLLLERGHEVGCHTYSHIDCGAASVAEVEANCLRNERQFAKVSSQPMRSFAYPFGEFGPRSKRFVGARYATARSSQPGVNSGKVDLAALHAVSVDMRGGIETVRQWMSRLEADGGWAIMYTHGVCSDPTPFDSTPELLATTVDLCLESGFECMTVADASALCRPC